ncbi:MAG: hypothetical protein QW540_08075 [Archaeoglobaceae archaeon]
MPVVEVFDDKRSIIHAVLGLTYLADWIYFAISLLIFTVYELIENNIINESISHTIGDFLEFSVGCTIATILKLQ